MREKGTGRIVAIAETYELALDLAQQVRAVEIATWAAAVAISFVVIVLLFTFTVAPIKVVSSIAAKRPPLARQRSMVARKPA